jgi:hypothetical protein
MYDVKKGGAALATSALKTDAYFHSGSPVDFATEDSQTTLP